MEVFATKIIKIGDIGMGRAACDFHMRLGGWGRVSIHLYTQALGF